jgi:SNF2 family DNA or RNA helicase
MSTVDGKWINTSRKYGSTLQLTEHDDAIEDKPGNLFTELLPHQKTAVKAMLDLENKRFVKIDNLPKNNGYSYGYGNSQTTLCAHLKDVVVETTAGVLSEKLGSGKSFEMLALISLNPVPRNISEISTIPFPIPENGRYGYSSDATFIDKGFGIEVRKTYKKLFRQTVIFVSKSVLGQWTQYIKDYTNFKVLVIDNVMNLRKLYAMVFKPTKELNRKMLRKFDIILVKNKVISGEFDVPEIKGTGLEHTKTKPILTIFGELFRSIAFARVVLDDFDTINIPVTARVVPALFTWFISSTTKSCVGNKVSSKEYYDIRDIVTYNRPTYVESWKNKELFAYFNICNVDAFIDKSTNVGKVRYYSYKFTNPNEQYIGLIGAMGSEDSNAVMEMLNGDAVNTAAEAAGIKSTSVADIFEKILDTKWVKYKKYIEIGDYIPKVVEVVEEMDEPDPYDEDHKLTQAKLTRLSNNIHAAGPLHQVKTIIKYNEDEVIHHIDEVEAENNHLKAESGKAIERVKDNLKEGECPICCEELADVEGIMIMKCCGVTMCSDCVTSTLRLHNAGNNVQGTCPNCRRQVGFNQIVMIDKNIDINRIINEKINDEEPEPEPEPEIDENAEPEEPEEALNKFSCVVGLLNGKKFTDLRKVQNIKIGKILVGSNDLPEATEIKALVFANFNETLTNLQERLDKEGITYLRLQGTPNQINQIVRRYKLTPDHPEAVNVLLINGAEYCAGLNLQNTTDLIFTHKVLDTNVEAQIVGRAVRVGRTKNLNVHYVLYHNEFGHLQT